MTNKTAARYLILLGAPGAGKGTQAVLLTRLTDIPHLASGDIFRSVRQEQSELGDMVRSYYDRGLLVPDDVTIRLILAVLGRDAYATGAMLDGFPRTLDQARALDDALAQSGKSIWKVLSIQVAPDELLNRITGRLLCRTCDAVYHERLQPPRVAGVCDRDGGQLYQRVDDTVETGHTRLAAFFHATEPLVGYYRGQGKLCEVNGAQPVEAVSKDLQVCLSEEG
ncbi:MAG: adenylate kinase family protein [Dehalococcoidia bacterium]